MRTGTAILDSIAAPRFRRYREVREAIPGLEALDAKEAGLDVRVLQAAIRGPERKGPTLRSAAFGGQRALIALYVLLHCVSGKIRLLLIDEPDNFIALPKFSLGL